MSAVETSPVSLGQLHKIALLGGEIMKKHFTHFGMERVVKSDTTPVTKADMEINALVVDHVRKISRDIDIIGEEQSDRTNSPWQLLCDPVDGTMPYAWGMPVCTLMICVMHNGKPIIGVIYDPFTNRMYWAEKDKGAWMNGKRLQVSDVFLRADRPIVGYVSWPGCPFNILRVCQYLEERGVTMVNMCSIGYFEAAVANGEFAGTIFPGDKYHDTAPGHIIVSEAGGKVTDILGNELQYSDGKIRGHIMSNGVIHDLLLEAVIRSQ